MELGAEDGDDGEDVLCETQDCVCDEPIGQADCAAVAAAQYAVLTYLIDDPTVPEGCFVDTRSGTATYVHHTGTAGFAFSTTPVAGMTPICFDQLQRVSWVVGSARVCEVCCQGFFTARSRI